jgi:co-chaperonin GroES (HSP10)
MQPIKDYVIIQPQSPERKTESGLIIVTDYDPSTHVPVIGTVKELPHKLSNNKQVELQVGDIVYMDRYACLMAWGREVSEESISKDNSVILIDGVKHFYINYGNVYMAIRDGKKIMVNDYVLMTAVKRQEKSDIIIEKEFYSDLIFRCELGNDEINEGQYIVIQRARSSKANYQYYISPVEQHNYRTLDKEYYVVKAENIIGILNDINLDIR